MLRAILFDFDGVIADDELLHMQAFQSALREHDIVLERQSYYDRYLGFDDRECIRHVLADHGRLATGQLVHALVARKQTAFMEALRVGVPLFPGVIEFVARAAASYPLAIASGALRSEIEAILVSASLRGYFTAIASADEISVGKPDPAVFHLALASLNDAGGDVPITAGECVVIEDSVAGVEGAKRAGMRCTAVTNSYAAGDLKQADLVVASLEAVQLVDLEVLFSA